MPPLLDASEMPSGTPQILFVPVVGTRHWYLSKDQTRLVQLQNDRLIVNWRRLGTDVYPHFDQLRADLAEIVDAWRTFLADFDFPAPQVLQTEVTYINHIPAADGGEDLQPRDLMEAFKTQWPAGAGTPEVLQIEQRFIVADESTRYGTLSLGFAPITLPARERVWTLNLSFRGAASGDFEHALGSLDVGHNQVINTFKDVTTERMHAVWGVDE